jgi:hypothetical protein
MNVSLKAGFVLDELTTSSNASCPRASRKSTGVFAAASSSFVTGATIDVNPPSWRGYRRRRVRPSF